MYNAPAKKILTYARRWGVLELCLHDFPFQHPPVYWPTQPAEVHACPYVIIKHRDEMPIRQADRHPCLPRGLVDGRPWEPLEAWYRWALRARASVTIAAELRKGRLGMEQDWRVVCGTEGMPTGRGYWSPPRTLHQGWLQLNSMVNYWLRAAALTVSLECREKEAVFTVGGGGCLGHWPFS